MGILDRPVVARLVEAAEERVGVTLTTTAERDRWHIVEREYAELSGEAEELALGFMDYGFGRPHEMQSERRKAIAQRSRVALKFDPLAGAEAQLLADFSFGKGVPKPTARDEKVQQVIDEAWCHDEETEALTDEGWLGYRELRARWEAGEAPRLAQFDMESERIEFAEPLAMAATHYEGEMVRILSGRGPSFMVTPNHRMVTRATQMGTGPWTKRLASDLRKHEYVPVAAPVGGRDRVEEFVLPSCLKRELNGSAGRIRPGTREREERVRVLVAGGVSQREAARVEGYSEGAVSMILGGERERRRAKVGPKTQHAPVRMPMDAWLEWLGWYIAEGEHGRASVCQQLDSPRLGAVVAACAALGVEGNQRVREGRMWEWAPKTAKRFRVWLTEHVGTVDYTKRVPAFVFDLPPEQMLRLLDGYMGGDGGPADWRERGCGSAFTTSGGLADDLQRLATLCGWRAQVRYEVREDKPNARGGWWVYLTARREKIVMERARSLVPYSGDVWCFSMPAGTMVTRRDGRVGIASNTDANNEEKLTGYAAQRKLSNELLTAGELFPTLYVAGGKVRVGRLDADSVVAIVPDPEDRLRPLWYVAEARKFLWDYERDAPKPEMVEMVGGRPKVRYWKHWRNFDDAMEERAQGMVDAGEDELIEPEKERQAKGLVYHVAINQTGEELRGNPPWARTLRFMAAMNVLTEAHVTMAQASSSFIAKRVHDGTPRQVQKAAAAVLGHVSELGAGRLGAGPDEQAAFAPGGQAPAAPGSWWNENPSSRLEGLNLNSGAGQMAQSAQIVRAPIAAAASFGQHYLGDASQSNLATASTLELPATMRFESWQTYFEGLYRWFTDRAIEAAVHAGRLGGLDEFPEDGPMSEMRLHEAEDRAKMEKRTKRDLSYEFVMPYPGRRQLPEVGTFAQTVCTMMDPNGVNIALRRHVLRFAFENMGIDDVGHAVEECVPDEPVPGGIGPQPEPEIDPETGLPVPGSAPSFKNSPAGVTARPGGAKPSPGEPGTKNVRKQSTPPGESRMSEEWVPEELRAAVAQLDAEVSADFAASVVEPAVRELLALAGASSNGDGAHGDD